MEELRLLTTQEIEDCARLWGKDGAAGLLLLAGPDGFDGDYDEYKELLARLEEA